jgi:hypothetical protein
MKEFLMALLLAFASAIIVFYPIAIIVSLNTLFNLAIPLTFKTWVATVVLSSLFAANFTVHKK